MTFEDEVFQKKRPVAEKLKQYGFIKEKDVLIIHKKLRNAQFLAEITVNSAGTVNGKVIDMDTMEEYRQLRLSSYYGAFVGEIRQQYHDILEDIAEGCFTDSQFIYPQTERIMAAIKERYGEVADNPFSESSDYGVIRYPANRKWYLLMTSLEREKLGESDPVEKQKRVEIINIKCDPQLTDSLVEEKGIYRAYHMNKKSWITITLDDSLPDERIMSLIEYSRNSVIHSAGKLNRSEKLNWIVPANAGYFDIDGYFARGKDVQWKQGKGIKTGDTVFVYVSAPFSCIRYKCTVTKTDIQFDFRNDNVHMTHLMSLDVLEKYERDFCTFERLKTLGINAVRGPRTVTPQFLEYIDTKEKQEG